MGEIAIQVEQLFKQYKLGAVTTGTISHDLNRWWHKVKGKEDPYQKVNTITNPTQQTSLEYIWALNNVNFKLEKGEVLGIIGKNGAGKSTLLKILSKVTSPTKGTIKINGRIASLLEVGTGFHPELSGRENIFLNGAILGMSKTEISHKLEEIVEFSGVNQFIDTPVKRYSSGMYVRLAFAVAAHLQSDILIVDEVLAVGDVEFQKKCLGKMKDVSESGKTVIFVTHNLAAMNSLCNKAMVIENGTIAKEICAVNQATDFYLGGILNNRNNFKIANTQTRKGNAQALFIGIEFWQNGLQVNAPESGAKTTVQIKINALHPLVNCSIAVSFNSLYGDNKILLSSDLLNQTYKLKIGLNSIRCSINKFPLQAATYSINLFLKSNNDIIDWIQEALIVDVVTGDYYGTGRTILNENSSVLIDQNWESDN